MLTNIYDLDLDQLAALYGTWGEPPYRAKQTWLGLYQHFYASPQEFTNLPKPVRTLLGEQLDFSPIRPKLFRNSSDGQTRKTLFELQDGLVIEAVLMRYGDPADVGANAAGRGSEKRGLRSTKSRNTLCISTQAGCAMGCVFCATGQMGFKRNLASGEIVAQVMYYARMLRNERKAVTNIVLMGMGEPFHNYENTMAAIDRLNHPQGLNFGARRFTISTVGLVPQIRRFADEKRQVNLAISLHAADDNARQAMLPVNKKYNIQEVLAACHYYVAQTGRRVTFEWALIHGVNDTPEVAKQLAARVKGLLCHVNAIPLNPTAGYAGKATDPARAALFRSTLVQAGIPCTIRMRRGIDIQAGCGQLAGSVGL